MTLQRRTSINLLLLLLLVMGLGGCGPLAAWTAAQFAPPEKVPATYDPPAQKTFLVLVDDYHQVLQYEPLKADLTAELNRQLREHRIARGVVEHDELLNLMETTPRFDDLSTAEVGRELQADIVLYVLIDRFSLKESPANPLWQGKLGASVRLVDVREGRLWPTDRLGGYPVPTVQLPPTSSDSPTAEAVLSRALARRMADRIAKLFYRHEVPQREQQGFSDESLTR